MARLSTPYKATRRLLRPHFLFRVHFLGCKSQSVLKRLSEAYRGIPDSTTPRTFPFPSSTALSRRKKDGGGAAVVGCLVLCAPSLCLLGARSAWAWRAAASYAFGVRVLTSYAYSAKENIYFILFLIIII